MLNLWLTIKVFLKGMIMGAVNVFPISSGTASLILGVFERFVNAIKSLNHKNFKYLREGDFSEFARRTDIKFLLTISMGILVGMVLTSIFLKKTLNSYEVYTWSFFIGLIIASVFYVMKRIEKVSVKNILLLLAGFAISFMLSIKSNPYSNDNFFYLFLCGVVGATGMVVPGISGSHLMLLMGNYELIVTEAIPALTKASQAKASIGRMSFSLDMRDMKIPKTHRMHGSLACSPTCVTSTAVGVFPFVRYVRPNDLKSNSINRKTKATSKGGFFVSRHIILETASQTPLGMAFQTPCLFSSCIRRSACRPA